MMSGLPVEDDSKPYLQLIDAVSAHMSQYGRRDTARRLKAYMLALLRDRADQMPDVALAALKVAERTALYWDHREQMSAAEAGWHFLQAEELEHDFDDLRSCYVRAVLLVINLNRNHSAIDDITFWFFNFLDPLAFPPALLTSAFEEHFAKPARRGRLSGYALLINRFWLGR